MSTLPTTDRERLLQQRRNHADAVFDRLFPADAPQPPPTFDRLEERTRQLAANLASRLLERRVHQAAEVAADTPLLRYFYFPPPMRFDSYLRHVRFPVPTRRSPHFTAMRLSNEVSGSTGSRSGGDSTQWSKSCWRDYGGRKQWG